MCCGKGKSQNGGAQLRSSNLSSNGSGLISGEIAESSFLIYQNWQQLNFWGLTAKGEPKRQYVAKGVGSCVEVDSRDVKYLLSLRRSKRPYFVEDVNGNCKSINEETEKPVSYGVYQDTLTSDDILHVGIGSPHPSPEFHVVGTIVEDYEPLVLSQEEIAQNPLEGETLQSDMYLDSVGSPEILHQEEISHLVEENSVMESTEGYVATIEENEIIVVEPVITKTRKKRT